MSESREEVEARHRREIKAIEGERRAAVKKAKATMGRKAKDELVALEAEFDRRQQEMTDRHEAELRYLTAEVCGGGGGGGIGSSAHASSSSDDPVSAVENGQPTRDSSLSVDEADLDRQRKTDKARRKREKAKEKERERERQIEEELANVGPSARDQEMDVIMEQLEPLQLRIHEVPADGHCLYRAVAAHYDDMQYKEIRRQCADALAAHEDDFSPFCELSDDVPDYDAYVDRVRSSAEWGGHLELRALSIALRRPVVVYSAQSSEPLRIEEQHRQGHEPTEQSGDFINNGGVKEDDPIRLSYHRSYYALGEHYNQVVPVSAASDA